MMVCHIPANCRHRCKFSQGLSKHLHHHKFLLICYQLPFLIWRYFSPDMLPGVYKFVAYMLDQGVATNYQDPFSALRILCESYIWTGDEHQLALYIIERCGPINWAPRTWASKRNMQYLLSRQDDCKSLQSQISGLNPSNL